MNKFIHKEIEQLINGQLNKYTNKDKHDTHLKNTRRLKKCRRAENIIAKGEIGIRQY